MEAAPPAARAAGARPALGAERHHGCLLFALPAPTPRARRPTGSAGTAGARLQAGHRPQRQPDGRPVHRSCSACCTARTSSMRHADFNTAARRPPRRPPIWRRPAPPCRPSAAAGALRAAPSGGAGRSRRSFIQNGGGADFGPGSAGLTAEGSHAGRRAPARPPTPSSAPAADGVDPSLQQAIPGSIAPWAKEAADKLGVAPELVSAHAALESGWGQRPLKNGDGSSTNNLFGIKAGKPAGTATLPNPPPPNTSAARRSRRVRASAPIRTRPAPSATTPDADR
jgi:hypothetical protein